jgi:hypothetical protein
LNFNFDCCGFCLYSAASGLKSGQFDRKTDSSVVESDTREPLFGLTCIRIHAADTIQKFLLIEQSVHADAPPLFNPHCWQPDQG